MQCMLYGYAGKYLNGRKRRKLEISSTPEKNQAGVKEVIAQRLPDKAKKIGRTGGERIVKGVRK